MLAPFGANSIVLHDFFFSLLYYCFILKIWWVVLSACWRLTNALSLHLKNAQLLIKWPSKSFQCMLCSKTICMNRHKNNNVFFYVLLLTSTMKMFFNFRCRQINYWRSTFVSSILFSLLNADLRTYLENLLKMYTEQITWNCCMLSLIKKLGVNICIITCAFRI